MSRGRDESGKFTSQTTERHILRAIRTHPEPVITAPELASMLDVSSETARRYLSTLHDDGVVCRKEVGARAVVWWPADEHQNSDAPAAPLRNLVGLLDEDAAEQAEKRSQEWRERFDEDIQPS